MENLPANNTAVSSNNAPRDRASSGALTGKVSADRYELSADDLARLPALVDRYSGSGPRYTSYPTAVEFGPKFDSAAWMRALEEDQKRAQQSDETDAGSESGIQEQRSASLYFHIPYCRSLCYFCACNKIITQDESLLETYVDALEHEMRFYGERGLGTDAPIEQIHWGGGSPNYLSPRLMSRLHRSTERIFSRIEPNADISVELDPRTTSVEQIKTLRTLGFNRVSFGVQDFDPQVQRAINRIQPFSDTARLCDSVRSAGFSGLNVDLIYGLSFQTVQTFERTVDQVLSLQPERIALYGYAHVTWLQKVQKTLERGDLPVPSERLRIFLSAVERFLAAGYRYIGLDHFALPDDSLTQALDNGRLNRNFMGYTSHRGARIYAFGVSSISTLPKAFAQNIKSIPDYTKAVTSGDLAIERGLSKGPDDRLRSEVIERVMCEGNLDFGLIRRHFTSDSEVTALLAAAGGDLAHYFAEEVASLEKFIDDGLVDRAGTTYRLTSVGRLFARNVAMVFDRYLRQHREKRVFSQAV